MSHTGVPQLVTTTREQYLWQQEARIRSEAARVAKDDPIAKRHLTGVEFAEDLVDIHESAAIRQRNQGAAHFAESHTVFAAKARQLKLHHLDQLAHHLI